MRCQPPFVMLGEHQDTGVLLLVNTERCSLQHLLGDCNNEWPCTPSSSTLVSLPCRVASLLQLAATLAGLLLGDLSLALAYNCLWPPRVVEHPCSSPLARGLPHQGVL